jgi:hypothetical protein
VFPLLAIAFVVNGISLFRIAKHFPKVESEEDKAERKKTGMWFGIIFGARGTIDLYSHKHCNQYRAPRANDPVIALVVGLHFYPLAQVFKRTIDYYLATWSTVVAIFRYCIQLKSYVIPT